MNKDVKKNRPKAVIFDWDNTLANTWPVIEKSMILTLKEADKEDYLETYKTKGFGKPMRESFPLLFGDQWQEMLDIYKKHYRRERESAIELMPHAENLIEKLTELNVPLFIVSNKIGESLRHEVKLMNLDHYFHNIIGSYDTKYDKPHPAPVERAVATADIELDKNVWFFGDSHIDMQCAHNCNCTAIMHGNSYEYLEKPLPESDKITFISCFSEVDI